MNQENTDDRSLWETAYDVRTGCGKYIGIPGLILIGIYFLYTEVEKYNNKCMDKSLFKQSVNLEIDNEKPIGFIPYETYYALEFKDNRFLYSCNWQSTGNNSGYTFKAGPELKQFRIKKRKGSELFFIVEDDGVAESAFFIEWTE